jgi:formylglycine-generating enzyme required for sulfatase activity
VSIRLEGYVPVERTAAVKAGEDVILDVALQVAPPPPRVGAVTITTDPADADIQIGPAGPQRSPATFRDLAPGRVQLSVRREGFEPVDREIEVRAGETTTVPPIALRPKPAPARPVALALPPELTLTAGPAELRLVRLEPGEIAWGDAARGTAAVKLSRPVLMAVNEVTQAAFAAVMGENPSALKERRTSGGTRTIFEEVTVMRMEGGRQVPVKERRPKVVPAEDELLPLPDNPVENVTWDQAMEFCARLTRSATAAGRLPAGTVVRLPTEAEWQRAQAGAELGTGGRAALDRLAWTAENAADGHRAVRTRAANPAGIHDLDGNVAEWCLDAWNTVLPPAGTSDWLVLDPRQQERFGTPAPGVFTLRLVTDSLGRRVVRGGSFRYAAADFLSQPVRTSQASRSEDIGFRVVVGVPVGPGDSTRPN